MDIYAAFLEIAIVLSVTLIYAYLYWRYRDRAIGQFFLAAIILLSAFLLVSVYVQIYKTAIAPLAQYIKWNAYILGSGFICGGIATFVNKPFPKSRLYCGIACLILNAVNHFYQSMYIIDILIFSYNAVFLTLAGKDLVASWMLPEYGNILQVSRPPYWGCCQ